MMSVTLVITVIRLSVHPEILAAVSASADSVYCAAEDAVNALAVRRSAAVRTAQQLQRYPVEQLRTEKRPVRNQKFE